MFKFTRTGLNRVVFIISIIIFCCIQIFIYKFTSKINSNTEIAEDIMKSQEEIEPEKSNKEEYLIQEDEQNQEQDEKITTWQIEIPAISLTANISEGTEKGCGGKPSLPQKRSQPYIRRYGGDCIPLSVQIRDPERRGRDGQAGSHADHPFPRPWHG